jgi:hypothetical protein
VEDEARYHPDTSPLGQPASSNCIIAPSLIKLYKDLKSDPVDESLNLFDEPKWRIRIPPSVTGPLWIVLLINLQFIRNIVEMSITLISNKEMENTGCE